METRSARHAVETGSLTAFDHGSYRTGAHADNPAGARAAHEFRRTLERPHLCRPGIVPADGLSLRRADRERAGLLARFRRRHLRPRNAARAGERPPAPG